MPDKNGRDIKFLRAIGFGKDESEWITQYDCFPVRNGFRSRFTLVGRGDVASSHCGMHRSFKKCSNVAEHHGIFEGKDIYHNVVLSCHRPSCCRCFKYGWATREANQINSRFLTAESKLGLCYSDVEHLSASAPKKDCYNEDVVDYRVLCRDGILALKKSGVTGGCTIFHGHRKDYDKRELFWSPHFHCLGYIAGGYDRCRSCVKVGCCWDCDGFEGVTRRAHVDDGWIVSLAKNEKGIVEKRNNVFGTAWYQLEHSSFQKSVSRFHATRWFGVLGYRKLKTVIKPVEFKCAGCHNVMSDGYLPDGVEPIVSNRGERGFVKNFMLDHVEDKIGG